MKVSIHQPSYFPWLGLLDKINKSDTFVVLDTVPLNDNAFQSRNIFLNHTGEVQYLTIPVQKKEYQKKMMRELRIVDKKWQKKHNGFMISNYKKHPFFDEVYPLVEKVYTKKYEFLIDILLDSMSVSHDIFDINPKIVLASELEVNADLVKDDLVIALLEKCQANMYISGTGAKSYQDENKFIEKNIGLSYQSFAHPSYNQKNASTFEIGLSALDVAFNLGIDNARKVLKESL